MRHYQATTLIATALFFGSVSADQLDEPCDDATSSFVEETAPEEREEKNSPVVADETPAEETSQPDDNG